LISDFPLTGRDATTVLIKQSKNASPFGESGKISHLLRELILDPIVTGASGIPFFVNCS